MHAIAIRPLRFVAAAGVFTGAALSVGYLASQPEWLRYIGAIAIFVTLLILTFKLQNKVIVPLIVYLALIGLLRRLIIPMAGWSEYDPLLVVGPCITLLLGFHVLYRYRYELFRHSQAKWVLFLMVLTVMQVANPFSGSVFGGLTGAMFLIVPWIWYCIAYFTFNRALIVAMLNAVQSVGLLAAGYGIYQTFHGYLPFEQQWLTLSGYASLNVGGILRAISTFPSASEFAYFCMATSVVSFARLLTVRSFRWFHLIAFAASFMALVLESSRTVMIFTVLAIVVMVVLRTRSGTGRVAMAVLLSIGLFALWSALAAIPTAWLGPAAPFMEHMVSGLSDPMHEDETGQVHIDMITGGLLSVQHNPVGYGIGAVTNSAGKVEGTESMQTEADFSNLLVAFGAPGIVYAGVVLSGLWIAVRLAGRSTQFGTLASAGLLIGGFTQWINGGFYTLPILIWSIVGWLASEDVKERTRSKWERLNKTAGMKQQTILADPV